MVEHVWRSQNRPGPGGVGYHVVVYEDVCERCKVVRKTTEECWDSVDHAVTYEYVVPSGVVATDEPPCFLDE